MAVTIKLSDIIDGMEMQSDMISSYLSKKTGRVIQVSKEEMDVAENEGPVEDSPDWQQDSIKTACEIIETGDYIPLPSKFDIHEYNIMEKFCLSINDEKISNILYDSIKSNKAFRRFKDKIRKYNIEENWYQYRHNAFRAIAKRWCEDNSVGVIDN